MDKNPQVLNNNVLDPIDGKWSQWSSWSGACSEGQHCCGPYCYTGSQTRQRTCTPPQYGGQDCVGQRQETRRCPSRDCPGRVRLVSVLKVISSPKILQSLSPPIPWTRVAGGAGAGVPKATTLKPSGQGNWNPRITDTDPADGAAVGADSTTRRSMGSV